ncbi:class I lanthipeptide [Maioricimonas sp. JC845]|uniref:class I lanthipeptide n=1 Tax=Maioricimonas sp. JC845 TaxID=3232138 RepID=UPI00345A5365
MKKLVLNKETVRSLNGPEMQKVSGGLMRLNFDCPAGGTSGSTTLQTMSKSCHGCAVLDPRQLIVNPVNLISR